jgi:CDP-glycerol glycerophosphotransferase
MAVLRQRVTRVDPDLVLYNSFLGRFSDNPRGIYEELVRRGAPQRAVWLREDGQEFPDVETVTPRTDTYLQRLGQARVVVGNTMLPLYLPKTRRATYLQTWHGTPLKKIGFDNPRRALDPEGLRRAARDYRQWDFLVSQNLFSTEIFRRAFRFEGEILESGYPRNDILTSPSAPKVRQRVREQLGIADDQTVVLYAPTFRDDQIDQTRRPDGLDFPMALDIPRIEQALGSSHVLLLRLHYWVSAAVADVPGPFTRNVSRYQDIRDLYLAADVLLTDYSSSMFDFAVTGKPMVFFTYDIDSYRDTLRGFYFDITEQAPGPQCRTTDEVIGALGDLRRTTEEHRGTYAEFAARYCPLDDGHAAARIVDRVWSTLR